MAPEEPADRVRPNHLGATRLETVVEVWAAILRGKAGSRLLLKNAGYEVVAYPSAQRLLDNLPDESKPGCILLDVQIPGLSGPDLQARLSDLDSTLPIVFLTGHGDIPTTVQAIKAGAQDFLTKPVSSDDLLGAVERALANYQTVHDRRGRLDIQRALVSSLTPRERQVFELVVRGKINKQIAAQLGTTERTIKAHRHKVMEKMKVQTLAELVSTAERLGMFEMSDKNRG